MIKDFKNTSSRFVLFATALSVLAVGACSRTSEPISVDEHISVLESDFKEIFSDQAPIAHEVSLHEAMARGILYNLDHRVSVMEGLIAKGEINIALQSVLPSLDVKGQYIANDEKLSYAPRSLVGDVPTLPESVFGEKSNTTAKLGMSWNAIDAGIAYAEAKNMDDKARVAEERRRKVVHSIIQDVRYAYWRAASAQILMDRIDTLIEKGKAEVAKLDHKEIKGKTSGAKISRYEQQERILENVESLMSLKDYLVTAKVELTTLINLSPSADIQLDVDEAQIFNQDSIPTLELDPESLELVALMIRPEIREDIIMKRIGARNIKATKFGGIPGVGVAFGYHYDGNDYLGSNDWNSFSVSIAQNLMKLFALPGRVKQAQNKEKLIEMRRKAMLVAVMSQVHLSRHRLNLAQGHFRVLHKLASVSQKISKEIEKTKSKSSADFLERDMVSLLNRARLHQAYAEYQNAYGQMLTSIGMDPLPQNMSVADLSSMTKIIEKRSDKVTPQIFDKLLKVVKDRGLHALSKQSGHVVMASSTEIEGKLVAGIMPASGVPEMAEEVNILTPKNLKTLYND